MGELYGMSGRNPAGISVRFPITRAECDLSNPSSGQIGRMVK